MAEEIKKVEEQVKVPAKLLAELQEQLAAQELKINNMESKNAGLEELFSKSAEASDEPKLRKQKSFEPRFRTVRIRKFPIAGDINNLGYVIGWTNRGAYEEVDKSGVRPEIVNFIDVIFLGHERSEDGKLQAEKIKLLDLLNKGTQVYCKITDQKKEKKEFATGEEIDVSIFDPQHGLISTGDKVDGMVVSDEMKYKIQVPGVEGEIWIDSEFCN